MGKAGLKHLFYRWAIGLKPQAVLAIDFWYYLDIIIYNYICERWFPSMATKELTRETVMALKEDAFFNLCKLEADYKTWLKEALNRTETRKTYPRKKFWNEEKQKFTYIADKSKKPIFKTAPISFFTLKAAFCDEMLGMEKKVTEKPVSFRDRLAALLDEE